MNENSIVDIYYRDKDIEKLIKKVNLIKENEKSSFIMIDGDWGSGKTTLLTLLSEKLVNDNNVLKYNCWENSFYGDPLIAIISTITSQLNNYKDIHKIGLQILQNFGIKVGFDNEQLFNFCGISIRVKNKRKDLEYKSTESLVREFKDELIQFNNKNKGPDNNGTRIIIVDELDRCLPEYAIKVLERMYLLFKDVPNTIVIIANNNKQLEYSIKNLFGNEFDYKEYLKKFVDDIYILNYESIAIKSLFKKYNEYFDLFDLTTVTEKEYETLAVLLSDINPRELDHVMKKLVKVHNIFFCGKQNFRVLIFEILTIFKMRNIFENYVNESKTLKKRKEALNSYQSNLKNYFYKNEISYGLILYAVVLNEKNINKTSLLSNYGSSIIQVSQEEKELISLLQLVYDALLE